LLACRPAACLSDRRPPVILYSAILWGVLSQPLRRSAHELANLGQHMARGCTRAVTGLGKMGECCGSDEMIRQVSLDRRQGGTTRGPS